MKQLTFVAISIFLCSCNRQTPKLEKSPTPVHVAAVEMFAPKTGERYSASLIPERQVTLAFKVNGFVESICQVRGADGRTRNIDMGDIVPQGAILARVRLKDYELQVDQATGQLNQARQSVQTARAQVSQAEASAAKAAQDFERASALYADKAMTRSDYDAAKAQFDSTRAQVEAARSQVEAYAAAIQTTQATLGTANLGLHDTSLVGSSPNCGRRYRVPPAGAPRESQKRHRFGTPASRLAPLPDRILNMSDSKAMKNTLNTVAAMENLVDLEGCLMQVEASKAWFTRRVLPLSLEQLRWRPDPQRWSIAECLDHLNITLALYLPKIDDAIGLGWREFRAFDRDFRDVRSEIDALQRMEPPVEFRACAPPAAMPAAAVDPDLLVDRFHQVHDRYAAAVSRAFGLDLQGIPIIEPIYPWINSLGGTLALIAAHDRRHMWQAEQVRHAPRFPQALFNDLRDARVQTQGLELQKGDRYENA